MKKLYLVLMSILISQYSITFGQTPTNIKQLYATVQKGKNDTAQVSRLISLTIYQIKKSGEIKSDLDSAADFLAHASQINNQLKDNTSAGRIYLTQSYLYGERKQQAQSKSFVEKAIRTFTKIASNYSYIGDAYIQLADFYSIRDSTYREKEKAVSAAITFYHLAKNWEREEYCHEFLGDIAACEDDPGSADIAENEEHRAIEIAKLAHKTNLQRVYDVLNIINQDRGNYKEALRYGLLALKTAESERDTSTMLCTIYNRLGMVYNLLTEIPKSADCFKKALPVALRNHDNQATAIVISNLSRAMKALDRSAEGLQIIEQYLKGYDLQKDDLTHNMLTKCRLDLNTDLKNYKTAQFYCDELIRNEKTSSFYIRGDYPLLINFFIQSKQYQKALKYLNLDNGLGHLIKGNRYEAENQRLWFMLDTAKREYKSAIAHLIRFHALTDSTLNETKSKQFASLELQFGKEKDSVQLKLKDQNIRLLNQNAQIGASKLKSAEWAKNVVFGTSILLLIILILVFYQFRLKQNTNKLITQKNLSMQQLLEEKEALLDDKEMLIKEVHHRVKNNLHMVSSLLESQSAYLENEALFAVRKSQHRVQAISILHQKLYLNDNITRVSMPVYLREIISYLKDSLVVEGNIIFDLHLEEIYLDVSQAVPMGLIVNEAVTNAIKYAFPQKPIGEIKISLTLNSANECLLNISDNGEGLPEDFDINKDSSLGMSLIKGLSKMLGAKLTLHSVDGTNVQIIFNPSRILGPT